MNVSSHSYNISIKCSVIDTFYKIVLNIKIFITGFYHVKVLTHRNRDTIFAHMKKANKTNLSFSSLIIKMVVWYVVQDIFSRSLRSFEMKGDWFQYFTQFIELNRQKNTILQYLWFRKCKRLIPRVLTSYKALIWDLKRILDVRGNNFSL